MSCGEIGVKIGTAAHQLPTEGLICNGTLSLNSGAAITATAANTSSPAIIVYNGPIVSDGTLVPQFVLNSSGADWGYVGNVSSGVWALGYTTGNWGTTLGSSALTWNSSGNVAVTGTLVVGTTPTLGGSPTSYGSMTLAGEVGGYAGIQFTSTTGNRTFMVSTGTNCDSGVYNVTSGDWDWYVASSGTSQSSELFYVTSCNGNWTVNGTANATSDIRKKKNLQRITDHREILNAISGYRFDWRKDGKASAGLISQEVEEVIPELVDTIPAKTHQDPDGLPGEMITEPEFKALNYNGIIGVLVEAVKALQAEVDELKRAR